MMQFQGVEIGPYKLQRLVGSGGMGEVYLALDKRITRYVALKVMKSSLFSSDTPDALKRGLQQFRKEAETVAQFNHPHILPLHEYNEAEVNGTRFAYMVMPYCKDGSLEQWLACDRRRQELSIKDIVVLLRQAGEALQYAHDHYIIHRDVKPGNFLLRRPNNTGLPELLLADFGLRGFMNGTTSVVGFVGKGTPFYMAPEQWGGHPTYATDQYALAVMAYQLFTGKLPFEAEEATHLLMLHLNAVPVPPSELNSQVPKAIDAVILKALEKRPQQRYERIMGFVEALEEALEPPVPISSSIHSESLSTSLSLSTATENAVQKSPVTEGAIAVPNVPIDKPVKSRLTLNKIQFASLLLVLLLLLGIAFYVVLHLWSANPSIVHSKKVAASGTTVHLTSVATVETAVSSTPRVSSSTTTPSTSGGFSGTTAHSSSVDIPMFGGGPDHTNYNPYEQILTSANVSTLSVAWKVSLSGQGIRHSSSALVNGTLYVGSSDGTLYAIDAASGHQIWMYKTGGEIETSPAVVNGVVYVGSYDRFLYAIDAQTGKMRWKFATSTPATTSLINASPTVVNNVVYIGSDEQKVYAINATTGQQVWQQLLDGEMRVAPAVIDNMVYVTSVNDTLYALNAGSGTIVWQKSLANTAHSLAGPCAYELCSTPSVVNNVIYVGAIDGNLNAVNATTGAVLWRFPTNSLVHSSPAVANNVVYVGADNGNVYAINAQTGRQLWQFHTGDRILASPVVANGVVYVGSNDQNVYALDAYHGAMLWSYHFAVDMQSNPILANGTLYVGAGNMYAFRVSS